MVDKRNLTSHTYNRSVAQLIFDKVVPTYLPLLEKLERDTRGLIE